MTTGVYKWSKTAATNASADTSINWAEGQSPSSVNDSARAMMARLSEYRDDQAGALTTAGTSTAYTLTSNQVFDSLADMSGQKLKVKFNATNGASPTLNVDSLGAKSLQLYSGTAIPTGMITANSIWDVTYDNSIPAFIVAGIPAAFPTNTISATSLAFSATQRLAGRYSASAGAGEELTLGTGILLSGSGVLSAASSAGVPMINGTIVESNATNAVTFAVKTLAGADPSSTDPVYFIFRNSTAGTGNYVVRTLTAALSITVSSGSTLGFANGTAGKLWFPVFDDGGTLRLGVVNCLSGTSIYPLGQFPLASSTAEGGAGAADSAHVIYTGTAVTSKPYLVAGYATYETGITTAGSWNASPTRIQLYAPGIPLPGHIIQVQRNFTGAAATGTTLVPDDDTIPQSTEGDQFMSQAITPSSTANLLVLDVLANLASNASGVITGSIYQDSGTDSIASGWVQASANAPLQIGIFWPMLSGTTSATTFKFRMGSHASNTLTFNGYGAVRKRGGVLASHMSITEIAA